MSQKVAASGRFWEGLDCQLAPLQAGPHERSQARMQHHNALICNVICLWTSTHLGTGICDVRLPVRHGRDRGVCHSQFASTWASPSRFYDCADFVAHAGKPARTVQALSRWPSAERMKDEG